MRFRSFLLLCLFLGISTCCFSQQKPVPKGDPRLVGVWQIGSGTVGSWLNDNWQFFRDGRFNYNLTGPVLNPLRRISGTYYTEGDNLYIRVVSYLVETDFKIEPTNPGVDFGSFQIGEGKTKTVRQNDSTYESNFLKILVPGKQIEITNEKYYRVSADPKYQ